MIKKAKRFTNIFEDRVKTLIVSAFGFVAALSWNDAVRSLINAYIPQDQNAWPYLFLNAIVVTIVVAIVIIVISKREK